MNIINQWSYKLKQVKQEIEDYKNIFENNELNRDMRIFCLSKIQSKTEYMKLIEETLKQLSNIDKR